MQRFGGDFERSRQRQRSSDHVADVDVADDTKAGAHSRPAADLDNLVVTALSAHHAIGHGDELAVGRQSDTVDADHRARDRHPRTLPPGPERSGAEAERQHVHDGSFGTNDNPVSLKLRANASAAFTVTKMETQRHRNDDGSTTVTIGKTTFRIARHATAEEAATGICPSCNLPWSDPTWPQHPAGSAEAAAENAAFLDRHPNCKSGRETFGRGPQHCVGCCPKPPIPDEVLADIARIIGPHLKRLADERQP